MFLHIFLFDLLIACFNSCFGFCNKPLRNTTTESFWSFFSHIYLFKTFQCLLNMNPYFSTRFIPSRLQHFMLIWEFWRNGAMVGLGIRPLEVLWPEISPKSSCRCTKISTFFPFIFSFFQTFFLSWIFVCQVADTFSYKK